jgi:tripartite-type tricarboxylate transporter receptor subunit TctC
MPVADIGSFSDDAGNQKDVKRGVIVMRFGKFLLCVALLALHAASGGAYAQAYPTRPITLVIPFAPGGSTSIVGRVIADRMSELLGEKIIVDNRPGAGGTVGTKAVAKSDPDGTSDTERRAALRGFTG